MTKVKVTHEVAEAIEYRRKCGYSNYAIIRNASGMGTAKADVTIRKWAFEEDGAGSPDLLIQALVVGCEIEKTPEDKVREYYETFNAPFIDRFRESKQYVIGKTLNLLGIKIGGINA